jgi:hypothetical protein
MVRRDGPSTALRAFVFATLIRFDWSNISGAASYQLQIDDSESFSVTLRADVLPTASEYSISTLPTMRMYWRARAVRRLEIR